MSEIVQFVPRPNPDRPTLLEAVEIKGEEFLERAPALVIPPCWRFTDEQIERYPPPLWNPPGTADLNGVPRAEE